MSGFASQRIGLKVDYLTSSSHTAAGCCLHFFQVVEQGKRAGSAGRPGKRLLVLVDPATFTAGIDNAISRSVMISKIETMCLFEEDLRPITGPLTQYDVLLQMSSLVDFIRTIGVIFKTNDPANPSPMYELEENQPISTRVNCRVSNAAMEDAYARRHGEEVIRRMREANSREVASLKEALQRQKDEQLHELVDLHTQNEQLRHTLAGTESLLIESKRAAKEHRMLGGGEAFSPPINSRSPPPPAMLGPVDAVTPPGRDREGGYNEYLDEGYQQRFSPQQAGSRPPRGVGASPRVINVFSDGGERAGVGPILRSPGAVNTNKPHRGAVHFPHDVHGGPGTPHTPSPHRGGRPQGEFQPRYASPLPRGASPYGAGTF